MADVNVNAPAGQAPAMALPGRTDDQILPRIRWVPIGKSNCYLDLDKSQSNPINKIAFWDTVQYDKSARCYRCQLDEQWFDLTKDTLREALQITPVNNNQAFISPPSSDALINFVNGLGYPKLVRNLSNVIFWSVVTRAHIDYAERIWEEFTQSIHIFIDDKRNRTQHTSRKKKATLIVIPSIRFTKLIIHHLQRRHKFHPRPDSPLYLPNEELVLGYLKFSAKGTKREVFRMPIPGSLITADIQEASYYQEYLANVAKHRRYLAGETGSDPDSSSPKPTKPARKPKSTAPKAPPRPFVSTPVTYAQPEPTSAPAKTQGKKRKPTTDISDKPSKATKSKYGFVSKKCKPTSTLKSMDKSTENVPAKEPQGTWVWKISTAPRGVEKGQSKGAPPYLFDPSDMMNLHMLSLDSQTARMNLKRLCLGLMPGDQDEGQAGPDPNAQDEGQAGSNPDEQSEGQAEPDPGNAGADEQPMPSHVVHAGSDRKHMDLDVADVSLQPSTEQMDEGFTATAYPKVQENLKLTVEEQVGLEEPATSSGTLSSLQHLSKNLSIGDLFFSDKPSEADHDKATVETEAKSMVSVTIQQDMSSIPPMTSPIIDLTSRPESPKVHQLKATTTDTTTTTTTLPPPPYQQQSTTDAMMMKRIVDLEHIWQVFFKRTRSWSRLDSHGLYEALEKSMNRDHSEELTKDLAEARKKKKKSRESPKTPPGSPPHQPPPPPPAGPSGASGAPGASGSSQVPPPLPPPSSTNQESQSKGSTAPSSSKTAASAEYQAWTTTDIRLRPSISLTLADLQMDEDMAPDEQAQSSNNEDVGKPAWSIPSSDVPVPTNKWASALASNYSPPPEDSLLAQTGDIATFMDWFCKRRGITELKPQDLEGPAFEIVKVFHPDVTHLQYQMKECHKLLTDSMDDPILRHSVSKPLPLGNPPGQVTIQSDFFFNKDLEYLRYGSKGSRPALSASKMKATYYLDVGLEQMMPDQFWIEEECKYDIAAMYGISHWWFQRQRFYIDRHTSEGDRSAIRTQMRILSVVRIEVFSMYGYDYMKKIVLRSADLNEHVIAKRDFKILLARIESYHTQLNLTKPRWDATGFKYKHDYTVIDSPRAVTFWDRYGVQMMMRFNEIHKFSDGTLQQIDEALDYRVKEFQINRMNPDLNTRFWTRKDVDRSKALMFAIQKRLKTRRIFRNLESFVGGRVKDGDYRLLKLTE
nr:histone deacetylase 14 [Tanacetum cinerariifolium]